MGLEAITSLLAKAGVLRGGFTTYSGRDVGGEYATLDTFGPPTTRTAAAPASAAAAAPSASVVSTVLSWILGAPVFVMGVALLFVSLATGLSWILAGLILLPPTNRLLARLVRFRITGWRKAVALAACAAAFFVGTRFVAEGPALSDEARYDLAFFLEDELGMRDVLVRQAGRSVEIRFRQPTMPAPELFAALATVSDAVEPLLPEEIERVRYVFTVNAIDAGYVEVPREAVREWRDGALNDARLVRQFKRVPLL